MKTVYKIICAVLSAAILPVLFFVPLLRFSIKLPISIDLGIKEYSSIFSLIRAAGNRTEEQQKLIKTLMDALTNKEGTLGDIFTNRPYLYAALVFFALTVLVAIALIVVSIITKKPWPVVGVAAGGLFTGFMSNVMFKAFAKPLISGEIGLNSLLGGGSEGDGSALANMIKGFLGNSVKVEHLNLSFAFLIMMLLFLLVAFTCICAAMDDGK